MKDLWKPMDEAAPKDKKLLLRWAPRTLYLVEYIALGHWEPDKFSRNPRPFWTAAGGGAYVADLRRNPPSHYIEIEGP